MKFEELKDSEQPYKITFEGVEVAAVQQAYLEDIVRQVKLGNVSCFSQFETQLARWEEGKNQTAYFRSYEALADKLEDFNERTDDMMISIANETAIPDHMKIYLVTRWELGEVALKLARSIRRAGDARKSEGPLPAPESVDIDAELTRFLGEADGLV